MSITRINEFRSHQGGEDDLFEFLVSLLPLIKASEGCISCDVLRSCDSSDKFLVIEQWASIQAHKKAVHSIPQEKMQAAMSLFNGPPVGGYYTL